MKPSTRILRDNEKRILRKHSEIGILGFAFGATCLLSIFFLLSSFNFAEKSIKPGVFTVACVFVGEALVLLILKLLANHDLKKNGRISRATRLGGYIPCLCVFTGNVFACAAGLNLIKKDKNLEYQIGSYALMVEIVVMLISALNILKGYVMSTFFPAMYLMAAIVILRLIALPLVTKYVHANTAEKCMWPLAILLTITAAGGNLLSLLMGCTMIRKLLNKDEKVSSIQVDVFRRLFRSHTAAIGMFFVVLLISLGIWSNYTFDYDLAVNNDYSAILQAPSLQYPLGTDDYGRDVFSRVVFGIRISLLAGFSTVLVAAVIGVTLGAVAGYCAGRVDNTIMRLLDVVMAVPGFLLPVAIVTALGTSIPCVVVALAMGTMPSYARVMRASVMSLRGEEFVEAIRACGAKDTWIITKHILPNSLAPLIVRATMGFGGAVLGISSLSYLGVGIQSHIPEWGNIMKAGSTYLESASWLAVYPGIAIIALVLSINFLGDGLRDALDPKMK